MTPDQANALIQHLAQKYLADLIPSVALEALGTQSTPIDTKFIDQWDRKVAFLHHWEQVLNHEQKNSEQQAYLDIIKQALWDQRKVWMKYEGKEKKFQFNCFGLVQRDQQFFVIGSFWEHAEPYLLSVRKITDLNLIEEESVPPSIDFNLQSYASFHLNHPQEPTLDYLEIEFPSHLLSYVKAYPLNSSNDFEITELSDHFRLQATNVPDSLRLRQWLSGFGDDAHIIEPEALRKVINPSLIDELTKLYNRRFFDRLFQREIQRYCRNPDYHFTLLSVDIDHFKKINDNFGHAMGDEALKKISTCFKNLREQDAIRLGGEEFIILLTDTTTPENSKAVADRIRNAVKNIQLYSENSVEPITLTVSI